jgi:hypothetical protein
MQAKMVAQFRKRRMSLELVNTASLIIATRDMQRFFELTGHTFRLVDVSSMNQSSL